MISCIVAQFALAMNIHTMDVYNIYRCEGSKKFHYLDRGDKEFKGVYNVDKNVFIITNERFGV